MVGSKRLSRKSVIVVLLLAASSAVFGRDPKRPPGPPPAGPEGKPKRDPGPPPGGPGDSLPGLSRDEIARFRAGRAQFLEAEDVAGGLGPVFNDRSCAACHKAAGVGGAGARLVTRFGRLVNGEYDPMTEFGGPLIQSRGIGLFNGVDFVGEVVPPAATIIAHRRTTPLFGLGLVDAVADEDLVMLSLHEAQLNPMTAGVPSTVADLGDGQSTVGRFGWKAQHATLFAFAADAYVNELGVTTPLLPNENCPQGNCALLAANPAKSQPNDDDDSAIQQLADFMTMLTPPPRGPVGPAERAGQVIFNAIGCADCHHSSLQTGASPIRALNRVSFSPYSDFLLHDMGSLGDGITQNEAGPRQMRTAPLWGLRFQPSLLHDGRTKSVEVAILAHDGQGILARRRFTALGRQQTQRLLAFLNSL